MIFCLFGRTKNINLVNIKIIIKNINIVFQSFFKNLFFFFRERVFVVHEIEMCKIDVEFVHLNELVECFKKK